VIIFRVLVQTVFLAFGQIWAHKTRAALTALGLIIGVASVTSVIGALKGMQEGVLSEFEGLGARKVWIFGDRPRELRGVLGWRDVIMTTEEADAILEHSPVVSRITPVADESFPVQNGDILLEGVRVTGIRADWHEIEGRYVKLGRTFTSVDDEQQAQVCLVNEDAIEQLRLDTDPVGDWITINGWRFLIIGVVETTQAGNPFGDSENTAETFIPFSTLEKMDPWMWIYLMAQLESPEVAPDARAQIQFVLRNMRGIGPGDLDTFRVEVMQQHIDTFNSLAAGITLVAAGVVGISLIVGGVGIMNIMLVSVSERTREIGLRKAVGAKSGIVLLQFLTEAVVLCLAGGAVGIAVGQALVLGLKNIPQANLDHAEIPLWAFGVAFAFSAAVGLVFGIFPALKAARLDPIVALRKD